MEQTYKPETTTEVIEDLESKNFEAERMIGQMAKHVAPAEIFMLPPQSEEITQLLAALVEASLEFTVVKQSGSSTVPYKRVYSTLDDLNSATAKALAKHGLRIIHQQLPLDRDFWILATKLWHSKSAQWIGMYSPIDPEPPTTSGGFSKRQEWGKDSTYIRKFHMADLLNLTPDSDTDGAPSSGNAGSTSASGKAAASAGAAQGKRKQSAPEKKTWAYLNTLGIDQAAWKADLCKRYKVDSCTKIDNATWRKIANSLTKYNEFVQVICEHWQAKAEEVFLFLLYKFGHRIGDAYDTLHEALNSENGKMAELLQQFTEWKELPEDSEEVPVGETEEPSEADQLLAQIQETLEAAGHDATYIENRMHGLQHQKVEGLKKALATAKKQAKNGKGKEE